MTAAESDKFDLPGAVAAIRDVIAQARNTLTDEVQAGITLVACSADCAANLAETLFEREDGDV